jgi:hypothetical protein
MFPFPMGNGSLCTDGIGFGGFLILGEKVFFLIQCRVSFKLLGICKDRSDPAITQKKLPGMMRKSISLFSTAILNF